MGNFLWIILSICVYICYNFFVFWKAEWRTIYNYNFSFLKTRRTPVNRFLLFMLDDYKYISHQKRERNYYYYSKKICKFLLLLSIPWLVTVYLMKWYLITAFFKWHLILSMVVGLLPTIVLVLMKNICDVKAIIYRRKQRKKSKEKDENKK